MQRAHPHCYFSLRFGPRPGTFRVARTLLFLPVFRRRRMNPGVAQTREATDAPPRPAPLDGAGTAARPRAELPRRLGFWEATLIVIGVTIGSGIFRVPASVADTVGSPAGIATV